MQTKSLFQSRTFWFNLLSAAAEVAQTLSGTQVVPAGAMLVASNAINIGLRMVTDRPVHLTPPPG